MFSAMRKSVRISVHSISRRLSERLPLARGFKEVLGSGMALCESSSAKGQAEKSMGRVLLKSSNSVGYAQMLEYMP